MFALLKKEINSFFGSLIGYLVILVFLLVNGLFLWIFPGNFNVFEGGYASLEAFFSLAPWVYLFLVPAVTMRLFADEKRAGTLELLLTRPLSDRQIVWGKFLAGLLLVLFSLLPTLLYLWSVVQLGNPVGNIDSGASWGSYIGLFFLACIYVSIGIFSSSLTDNQIVAFIFSMILSFFFYLGFEIFAGLDLSPKVQSFFVDLGINEHYRSISRGVVDSRDISYYGLITLLFLIFTEISLSIRKGKRGGNVARYLRMGLIIIILIVGVGNRFFRIDLTSEKRYTLSDISKQTVEQLKESVNVQIFLEGELPAGFRKMQQAIEEKLYDLDAYAAFPITYKRVDPYEAVPVKQRQKYFQSLMEHGIVPTNLRIKTGKGTVNRYIFPGVIIQIGNKAVGLNLLKNNPMSSEEVNLNNSIELLEYEFVRAFRILTNNQKETVAFLTGHRESGTPEIEDIRNALSESFLTERIIAKDLSAVPDKFKVLIIANPSLPFTEKEKYSIDQFIMRGGRVMWLFDPVQVSLDSLSLGDKTLAFPRDLNLLDQLFRYGVRVNSDLAQDVECQIIQVNTAPQGQPPRFRPAPWYYSPLATPSPDHPLTRNLNRVKTEFVSTIDMLETNPNVKKNVLLSTSKYSRKLTTPVEIGLASINEPPARSLFNQGPFPVGVLLEGSFPSVFKNRMVGSLGIHEQPIELSKPTKMVIISDGRMIENPVRWEGQRYQIKPLGYDRFSKQTFGNRDFLVNAIHYLADDSGIMQLRSRVVRLRLLDKVKLRESKLKWQLFNILLPIVFVIIFGIIFALVRIQRYGKKESYS